MLEAKVDAGANRAITQFFFDNDDYWRYLDRVRARGINIPIIPGLIPIHNFKQVANFASRCGASFQASSRSVLMGFGGSGNGAARRGDGCRRAGHRTLSQEASRSFTSIR